MDFLLACVCDVNNIALNGSSDDVLWTCHNSTLPPYSNPAYPNPAYPNPAYPNPAYPNPTYPEPTYLNPAIPNVREIVNAHAKCIA